MWLQQRLAIAQHAGELLKNKLAILNREEHRVAQRAADGTGERLCPEAETWTLRAAVLSEDPPVVGSAAVIQVAEAARAAVEAALSAAVAAAALRALRAELAATRRTLRAVEQRWIPRLSTALAEVRLELEELEHAEGVRHRWAVQQRRR